ncbi:snoRNA-binding rRNA-processing protein utp10 [Friedmanniomyces endolithicus]|nr:snoRNA-binding rRNA-processing protein utp10 [Friedmanniomyces endolithicus]KAK1053499.1 snoRNA-binding rRNA-processing protein utp10 [Friedmanniomyces endolithicus]
MATALQQQLAAIAANSTHQLDLKAQKARHSKSLLFEPRDAASQSFDTIYQICYEGFEELCMLDARFSAFGRSLFSEQSKDEDRTQMTAAENQELDRMLETFLGLVGARLLLKPAMKAVEWLVRRFRVQEYNTEALLLTFLPYHTSHIFPTLLSILPDQLPPMFRFLHPYVASLHSPPRHALLAAAINNQGFFSAFSQYALRVARARHHSAVLLGFWASITAQAVNGMVDATRSGREAVRKQREEDVLLRVLPILQSALSIKSVPELYLGACMIMTILATKASIADKVLDAMMDAIAGAWMSQTTEDGLTCLAVIAEEKEHVALPAKVARAVLKADASAGLLQQLSQRHRIDKLVLGIALSGIEVGNIPGLVTLIRESAERKRIDLSKLAPQLALEVPSGTVDETMPDAPQIEEPSAEQPGFTSTGQDMTDLDFTGLPTLVDETVSFLDPAWNATFEAFLSVFETACASGSGFRSVLDLPQLQRSRLAERPAFLTLLARVWSSSQKPSARARALEAAVLEIRAHNTIPALDWQALLPCVIVGLADTSQRARRAAAKLCVAVREAYGSGAGNTSKTAVMWAKESVYGAQTARLHSLSAPDAQKFIDSALLPILEDCILDGQHVSRALSESLKGSESNTPSTGGKEAKAMRTSLRSDVCTFLASNVTVTPVLRVKLDLLAVINRVGKVGSDARKKVLLPLVEEWAAMPCEEIKTSCLAEGIAKLDLDRAIIGSMSYRSSDEVSALQEIAAGGTSSELGLQSIAVKRLGVLFASMKAAGQTALADFLLNVAVGEADVSSDALEALRTIQYTTEVLVSLVGSLPNAADLQDEPTPTKKRRTSKSEVSTSRKPEPAMLDAAIRRITLVLEVLEGAHPERHPQLLQGLFHLLGELHQYKTLLGSQLVYLQGLLMGCLLSVVKGLKDSPKSADVDRSVIRADLIVETVRTTSSAQVHNTALLLVSELATWAPELVLHSVMPLFTFMSTTLLRQSDEYSAHVTDQTVSRIVPPLAASLKKRGKDLVTGASELLLSFTAAFEHIPLHRRSGLFQHLVQTLGAKEALFAVSAMLIERYPTDSRVEPFVGELMGRFPVATQLLALKQYLDLVFDALSPKRNLSNVILAFGEKDAERIEASVNTLLQTMARLMENPGLRKRVVKEFGKSSGEAGTLQSIYAQLLEQTMLLSRDLASNDDLRDAASSVLTSLLGLTPTKDFIESSAQLMQTGSDETRQEVFQSLESRVAQAKRGDSTLQQTFLEVLPNCCVFVAEEQPVAVRHAAITCMDQIIEKYGKRDRAAVLQAAKTVSGDAALGSEVVSLRTMSVLCLASMVEVLGDEFIPILPKVLSKTLDYLDETQSAVKCKKQTQSAAFGFATAVLDHLPWMYSAKYLDWTLQLAAVSRDIETDASSAFCTLAPSKIQAEPMLSSLDRTFSMIVETNHEDAVQQHLGVVRRAIQHNSKRDLKQHSAIIFSVLLAAFDIRRIKAAGEDHEDYAEVLAFVDTVAVDLVLKLDDQTFRPFFIRFVEWAATGLPKKDPTGRHLRLTSLYSFAHHFFDQLQSIVTSYASHLLENAAQLLTTLTLKTDEQRALLQIVLQTLSSSFRHDQDDFWQAPDHFNAIVTPLLSQLEKAKMVQVTDYIIPAITEFAAAAASPEHHKAMNVAIMAYTRHESADVRLAAAKCERAITERLGLDWLALLPEMLPFISELQEDDDEDVERETLRWVRQIEDVTGESLEGMLQ